MPVLAPLFKVFGQKFSSYGNGSNSGPQSHNMQVFTKSGTHNNTNTGTKFPRYPENISDNESQETILNKDKNGDKDEAKHTSIDSVDSKNKGIMRTVQVNVEREPAQEGDYERMGSRMN
jgi:hypothetical protein